ncbi:bifunctional metallophosphatase/5'-nucleotidase [Streptomyces capparidis]
MTASPAPSRRRTRKLTAPVAFAAVFAAAGALLASGPAATADSAADRHGGPGRIVDVQLLAFNDLHGNLEPPQGSSGTITEKRPDGTVVATPAGGVEYLATALRKARAGHSHSITAAAGDMIGGSPLLSGLFHDEPTVEAMNKLGLDVSGVGNHEFDEGRAELLRMQNGGCHPKDGCAEPGQEFAGADFPYLAANVTDEKTGKPILKPYWVKEMKGGVRVGFIGVTLEGTPDIVTAEGVKGLKFHDEVETINKYTRVLERQGVKSVVALVHEGGLPPSGSAYDYDCDSPGPGAGISGPIVDIAEKLSPQVDAVVTGHTHQAYACTVPDPAGRPRTVTSAASFGRLYTDLEMRYDRRTGDIVRTSVAAANHVVRRDQPKASDMTALIERWQKLAAPVANRPVGWISADVNGRGAGTLETPLGNVIADAQLEGLAVPDKGGAQIAFMNPGGVRSDLAYKASGAEGDGVVTYAEAFTVQPFTNMMNVLDLTGAQLVTALQQQVSGSNEANPRILHVSRGLTYTLDLTKSGAARVVTDSVRLNGEPIDPAKTYRVAMNEFLGGGGDGFPVFKEGKNKLVGASDLEILLAYLGAHSSAGAPLAPPATDRITVIR